MRAGPASILAALIVLLPALAPLVTAQGAQEGGRFVPQSLWGVRGDVGVGFAREYVTNYGNRSFWEERPNGEGVRIGLIDTGINPEHPDLDGTLACEHCWRDFVDDRPDPYDDNGHGTHVAGILAGNGHFQPNPLNAYFPTGARGLATGADLIVAKAMNASGGGSDERVAEAIRWALDPDGRSGSGDEAHILHLSLGVRAPTATDGEVDAGSQTVKAVREAIEQGVFVVMSAGNQGEQGPAPPGNVDGVLAVGGLTADGTVLPFSNRGPGVDVFAPGVVMSAWPRVLDDDGIEDGYTGLAGTSQAAPVVSGALALALEANPGLKEGGGATKVTHMETIVRETSQRSSNTPGSVRVLDADGVLTSQDAGANGIAGGIVAVLSAVALLVAIALARAGWKALARYVEEQPENGGEQGPASSGPPDGEGASFQRTRE